MAQEREFHQSMPFNMSLATLERIDKLLKDINQYYIIGDIVILHRSLYCLYSEIDPFLSNEEKKQAINYWNKCKDDIQAQGDENNTIFFQEGIINRIMDFNFWLRNMAHKHGLLMQKPDSPEFALGNV